MTYVADEKELDCVDGVKRKVQLEHDEDCESPRENDPLGVIVCVKGNRSGMGDKQVESYLLQPEDGKVPYIHGCEEEGIEDRKPLIVLPVGKYEHGGISLFIGTRGQDYPWDSGQVGWVYTTAERWKEWNGSEWKDTPENQKRLEEILEAEVEEYGHWLNGDCWGYRVLKQVACSEDCTCGRDPTWEDDDDFCRAGGYIGDSWETDALEDGIHEVEAHAANIVKARRPSSRLKKWWQERVRAVRRAFCKHTWGQQATVMTTKHAAVTAQWCSKGCGAQKKEVKAA